MRKIIGIDPGLQNTGWGIVGSEGSNLCYIACGTIRSDSKKPLAERLLALHNGLKQILELYKPDEAAIEETFINKNALSSLKLGHARGVLMMTVSLTGLPVKEYSATKVKKAVVGVGRAEKNQVENMIKILLPNAKVDSPDAADALAVAICHIHHPAWAE